MGTTIPESGLRAGLAGRLWRGKARTIALDAAALLFERVTSASRRLHASRHTTVSEAMLRHLSARGLRSPGVARVLALGSDGAVACFEALLELRRRAVDVSVEVVVVDDDQAALDVAAERARRSGVGGAIRLVSQSPWDFVAAQVERRWDVVEATGILDTVPFHDAMVLIRRARRGMLSDGLLVASQLRPDRLWDLDRLLTDEQGVFRRSRGDFVHMLRMAGFDNASTHQCSEPRGVCSVAIHGPDSSHIH